MDLSKSCAALAVLLTMICGCGQGEFNLESKPEGNQTDFHTEDIATMAYNQEQKMTDDLVVATLNRAIQSLATGDLKSARTAFTKRGWRFICNSDQPESLDETSLADRFMKSSFRTAGATTPEFTINLKHRSEIGIAILEIDYTYKVSDYAVMLCVGGGRWLIDSISSAEVAFDSDLL
ncbi:hypothetical protein [Planctopirus hydrillae]|uniref:Uncharacterized protein n=1 Tax=Planctopirus hydrillae TaxID=1841610 RepID=A0A1C3E8R0_9PLAN|nr:hypothetical protein [Planctopirus hydrillae]ODA29606.1 hypothetical protein A6X21_07985 [Planctopirus hydrillae]